MLCKPKYILQFMYIYFDEKIERKSLMKTYYSLICIRHLLTRLLIKSLTKIWVYFNIYLNIGWEVKEVNKFEGILPRNLRIGDVFFRFFLANIFSSLLKCQAFESASFHDIYALLLD